MRLIMKWDVSLCFNFFIIFNRDRTLMSQFAKQGITDGWLNGHNRLNGCLKDESKKHLETKLNHSIIFKKFSKVFENLRLENLTLVALEFLEGFFHFIFESTNMENCRSESPKLLLCTHWTIVTLNNIFVGFLCRKTRTWFKKNYLKLFPLMNSLLFIWPQLYMTLRNRAERLCFWACVHNSFVLCPL